MAWLGQALHIVRWYEYEYINGTITFVHIPLFKCRTYTPSDMSISSFDPCFKPKMDMLQRCSLPGTAYVHEAETSCKRRILRLLVPCYHYAIIMRYQKERRTGKNSLRTGDKRAALYCCVTAVCNQPEKDQQRGILSTQGHRHMYHTAASNLIKPNTQTLLLRKEHVRGKYIPCYDRLPTKKSIHKPLQVHCTRVILSCCSCRTRAWNPKSQISEETP